LAALWGYLEALQKVWEWIKENLTTDEVNNKFYQPQKMIEFTFWNVAAEQGDLETLQKYVSGLKTARDK